MSKCTCLVFLFHFLFDVWQVCMQSPGLFDQTVTLRSADSTQRVSRPKHLTCIAWLSLHIKRYPDDISPCAHFHTRGNYCSQYFWTIPRGRVQRKPRRDKRQTESKKKWRKHKCSTEVRCKMLLFWEVASLEVSKNRLDWSPGKLPLRFLPLPNHLLLPVKTAQYSFWQKTLNKAFPGSVRGH